MDDVLWNTGETAAVKLDLTFHCFVFDFDGTLVQSNAIKREGFFEAAEGLSGARRELRAILGDPEPKDRRRVFEMLVERLGVGDPAALTAAYSRYCQNRIARCAEVPGAMAVLEALRDAGRAVFVNSGTPENALLAAVKARGYEPYLDGVFGQPSGKVENILRALKASSATAESCIVIGDGEPDRAAAAEIGCDFIGVRGDGNDFSTTPAYLLDDLMPLVRYFSAAAETRAQGAF